MKIIENMIGVTYREGVKNFLGEMSATILPLLQTNVLKNLYLLKPFFCIVT